MDRDERLEEDVGHWLAEGPPPILDAPFDDLAETDTIRPFRGRPGWWNEATAPEDEILKEHPATARRNRLREWSERFGWIHDLWACLVARCQECVRSVEFLIGFMLMAYGCGIVVTLVIVSNHLFSTPPRELPTIDELMAPPTLTQDAPDPKDGLIDTDEKR